MYIMIKFLFFSFFFSFDACKLVVVD